MAKKVDLTTCSDEECIRVTAHQLTGAARAWWDSYCDTHAFREHHVPEGVMDAKVEDFSNISQGSQKI